MASNTGWIPMRKDLAGDPAVLFMSSKLHVRAEVIVGYLHAFWSWCDDHVDDGTCQGVTLEALGERLSLPGFPELVVKAGWLKYDNHGDFPIITIPNYDHHMSENAKKRAKRTESQRKRREAGSKLSSASKRLPQNRTEQNSIKKKVLKKSGKDDDGYSDAFQAFWESFSVERRTKKPDAWRAWVQWECEAISEKLISASERYAKSTEGRGDYCQGPGPWLDGKRWQDYQAPEKPKVSASQERQENEAKRVRIIKEGRSRGVDEDVIESALQKAGLDEL